jgi:hypothetical protein
MGNKTEDFMHPNLKQDNEHLRGIRGKKSTGITCA